MTDSHARPSRAAILLGFAAIYLVWGSTYLAIRYAVETIPPLLMAGTRFFIAGLLMYGWARLQRMGPPTRPQWRATLIVGAFLLLGGNGLVSWAEQRVPSGMAALLVATTPLWMVLMEWARGGSRPSRGVWTGIAIGFVGLVILVGPSRLLGAGAVDAYGALALIGASLSWAWGSVVSKRLPLPAAPQLGTGMEMLGGGALLVLVGTLRGEWSSFDPGRVSAESWTAYLYLILVGSLVGFSAYVWLLRHVEVAKVSTYAYVNPVVAVGLGWLIAGEVLTTRTLVAAGVIVAGVVFITSARRAPTAQPDVSGPPGAVLGAAE